MSIPYTKPSIGKLEIDMVTDAITNGWESACYQYIERFEREFAERLGVKHAIATSSCTGALHMGLKALGIKSGMCVALADINWIATVAPIIYLGAKPNFVDIEKDSWCIDPLKITGKIDAIIATHLYGNLCDMDLLQFVADTYNVPLIEDAAEAIGSKHNGRYAGTMGKFGVFSFHGTKTMTTGEGGMFITNDTDLYEKVLTLSNHGRNKNETRQFYPEKIGFKYKMSNIQAALGCAQLHRLDELVDGKREVMIRYRELLPNLTMNPEREGCFNSYWMPTVVFDNGNIRDAVMESLKAVGVDARPFFHPLSSLPMSTGNTVAVPNPVSYDISGRAINLPSYVGMGGQEIIAEAILNIIKGG